MLIINLNIDKSCLTIKNEFCEYNVIDNRNHFYVANESAYIYY